MQSENRFFDDLSRVASGAVGALAGLRDEIEGIVRQRVERLAGEMNLVRREEFDAAREMAANARAEQEALATKLAALEARIAVLEAAAESKPKRAPKASQAE